MLGGGEQYFQEPPGFSVDTLKAFAAFAHRLRALEGIKGRDIEEVCALAKAVGNTPAAFELVVGLVFRHIKTWRETKQLAGWYVMHKLCRDDRDTYGHEANKYVLEVGRDYIPWENAALAPKYEQLVQKWNADRLFSDEAVRQIWQGKAERAEQLRNPQAHKARLLEEEAVWKEEDMRHQELGRGRHGPQQTATTAADRQTDVGQPCLDYLQGNCAWGNACRLLHPPGLQGSLPPECRLGDWKCPCGTINRHFRRRCSACPKEKPQYRRSMQLSAEDRLLCAPEDNSAVFSHQFGYDPTNAEEAVRYWTQRLAAYSLQQWREERSDAYRSRILGVRPANGSAADGAGASAGPSTALNFPAGAIAEAVAEDETVPSSKRHRTEGAARLAAAAHHSAIVAASEQVRMPSLPSLSPSERIPFVSRRIIDSGILDANLPALLYLLTDSIKAVAGLRGGIAANVPVSNFEPFFTVCTLIYGGWNTGKTRGIARPFFEDLLPFLLPSPPTAAESGLNSDGTVSLPVPEEFYGQLAAVLPGDQPANLRAMAKDVLSAPPS